VTLAAALLGGAALKLVMKTLVMPLLGTPATNTAYAYLVGNTAALPAMFFLVIVGAGFGEELIWRGLLFDRVRQFVGWSPPIKLATVVLTASLFGAAHLHDQGLAGAEQAFLTGLVFGGVYARTACIWPIMVAHAAFDAVAVLIIYFDLERVLAHLFLR
jgi:membrane protease YdiL (CAAX protease family)